METVQLLPKTRELLSDCDLPLKEIADGAGVGFEWLRKFKAQADHDFGVQKVQALHDYLEGLARKNGSNTRAADRTARA